jgi:cobalt-zinc-cadmium efflux system protein
MPTHSPMSQTSTAQPAIGACIVGRDAGREDLHIRSVVLDTGFDAATSAAVALTGGIIWVVSGVYWLDSVVAVGIGLVIGVGAVPLLRDVCRALRAGGELRLDRD